MEQLDLVAAHDEMLRRGANGDVFIPRIGDQLCRLEHFLGVGRHVAGEARGLILLVAHRAPSLFWSRIWRVSVRTSRRSSVNCRVTSSKSLRVGRPNMADAASATSSCRLRNLRPAWSNSFRACKKPSVRWLRISSSLEISLHLANASRHSGCGEPPLPVADIVS